MPVDTSKYTAITVTFWKGQAELIQEAAAWSRMRTAEWVRETLPPIAAQVLGRELPSFPKMGKPLARLGTSSQVELAAQAMGMSVEDFRAQALEHAAESVLDQLTRPQTLRPSGTMMRPLVKGGR